MEELATVVDLKPDCVVVQSQVKSSCSQCQQVDNCGSGQVAKAFPQPKLMLEIPTQEAFDIGDKVLISIPEQALLSVAWQVYLWPILGLIGFAAIAQFGFFNNGTISEGFVILFALLGGYLGFKFAKHRVSQHEVDKALQPQIKQKVSASLAVDIS
ncbi:SoxR reducing system RseC family protein [Thalassotalea sp. M1531]|uniref:SoxR reducing system RseC family protein n=1 Tax=Thalassotalea algicola TaxID=2716224 RepID=A0A7Y0L9K0_9GAMM|nr:SoxR reducing system RseC family protein [Thalassotalea algicola]NMP29967.1 SoxR reducing system RseC family protein [Thalassotalea algicola]